jgi:hypothetical protein
MTQAQIEVLRMVAATVALSGCGPSLPASPDSGPWTKQAADAYMTAAEQADRRSNCFGCDAITTEAAKHYWPPGACVAGGGMRVPSGQFIPWGSIPRLARYSTLIDTFPDCQDYAAEKAAEGRKQQANAAAQERRKHQWNPDAPMPRVSYDMNVACNSPYLLGYHSYNACIDGEQAANEASLQLWPRLPVFYQEVCGRYAPYSKRLTRCIDPAIEMSEPSHRFRE